MKSAKNTKPRARDTCFKHKRNGQTHYELILSLKLYIVSLKVHFIEDLL